MNKLGTYLVVLAYLFLAGMSRAAAADDPPTVAIAEPGANVLWYRAPAANWEKEALPIGNGRLGGMIFGGIEREQIQFNEDSLWIGDEKDTGAYQTFGDVFVEFSDADGSGESYRRSLDIARGVHEIRYTAGGTTFRRTYFSSHPAQVIVFRFTADKPGAYSGKITLADAHEAKVVAQGSRITAAGSLAGYVYGGGSTRGRKQPYDIVLDYEAQLLVLNEGGTVEARDGGVAFSGCDALTILLAADTDYVNRRDQGWKGEHPHERITAQLKAAAAEPFDALLDEHVRDHRALFDRCAIDVGETPREVRALPIDERQAAYREGGKDPDLEELQFQFARYLMIGS